MNRLSLLASLALLTALAGTSQAANLEGETLHTLRAYPDVLTPFGPAIPDATVVAGTADQVTWLSYLVINPEPGSIQINFTGNGLYIGSPTVFDGLVFTGFSRDIQSFSVASNTSGVTYSLNHGPREIDVSLAGFATGGSLTLDVTLAPVPEPSALALMCTGLLATAGIARRRRGRAS